MTERPLSVTLERTYTASQKTVFQAFTKPDFLERWLFPRDGVTIKVRELDLRVGGRFQLAFSEGGHEADFVVGVYREISPYDRLVMTWTWEEPDPHAGIETLLTVDFKAQNKETLVVLKHEQFIDVPLRDRHNDGWGGALDNLERILLV